MTVSLIVAMARNGVIGRDNGLPWHLSTDLKRFKKLTMGRPYISGRRTFESVGIPLPGRKNIIISRRPDFAAPGVTGAGSFEEALAEAGEGEVFIGGGAEIFKLALPRADRIYLTLVHAEPEGDTFFPEVDWSEWRVTEREDHHSDERNDHPFSFITYERIRRAGV
jgi:dihydrofolate reductase